MTRSADRHSCPSQVGKACMYAVVGGFLSEPWVDTEPHQKGKISLMGPILCLTGWTLALLRIVSVAVPWALLSRNRPSAAELPDARGGAAARPLRAADSLRPQEASVLHDQGESQQGPSHRDMASPTPTSAPLDARDLEQRGEPPSRGATEWKAGIARGNSEALAGLCPEVARWQPPASSGTG
ncbi:unnamed protein product [Polarella glacialis]|uniref:Uncharacterized protein n=1 Tax=Polarella glacialis TaxID=89957 RepID=A0A813H0L2_POLGL|nr:unnamed protein product [Polarella glacialis]